jgi:dihydrofolate reductase
MRKLSSFTNISLDGYYADAKGGFSWGHAAKRDPEFEAFVADNAKGGGALLFGRVTYEVMVQYWPTPMAAKDNPVVADGMNNMQKFVFSRTLKEATWKNTTLVKGDLAAEVRKLKQASGDDMVILGSGSIVAQLAQEKLIDEFQIVVQPVVLGSGKTLFAGVKDTVDLALGKTRTFPSGKIFLRYTAAAQGT